MARNANDGPPSWPTTRNIDGYDYERHGVYATREEADAAVAELRNAGHAAQAFSSTYPKVTGDMHNGLYIAGCATVYFRDAADKAGVSKKATKKPAKKTAKKAAKKTAKKGPRTVRTKSGARVRATPKGEE